MPHIILPTTATEQGHAFEDLILSYYHKSGLYQVSEWSSYLHGNSGKWWQCDGIVENPNGLLKLITIDFAPVLYSIYGNYPVGIVNFVQDSIDPNS